MHQWKECEIELITNCGDLVPFRGLARGPWGLIPVDNQWRLVHKPTGRLISRDTFPQTRAMALAAALDALPVKWEKVGQCGLKRRNKELQRRAIRIVRGDF